MSMPCRMFALDYRRCVFGLIALIFVPVLIAAEAKAAYFKGIKKTVVLDPGHGGRSSGAKGPDGGLEKDIALDLATRLAAEIKKEYTVELTRSGDYGLDIPDRANAANHLVADVFISIHTGGSFRHNASGITIFYFMELPDRAPLSESKSTKFLDNGDTVMLWDRIQDKHTKSSAVLAKSIRSRISEKVKLPGCKIESAPLLVLRGADMPAVLIEAGYLTNPAEEKALKDPEVISQLIAAIREGIYDFFSKFE